MLIVPDSLDHTRTIAERMRASIEETEFLYETSKIPVTISLGVSTLV